MTNECNHAWETVERCFECGEIREYQPVHECSCPADPVAFEEMKSLVARIAGIDWRGKDTQVKDAIFHCRRLAGWNRRDWTA